MADADDTRVARQRKPSAIEMRAASEVSPRIVDAMSVPPGPEQDAILAEAFGSAIDLIAVGAKEMSAAIDRLRGALANAEQGRDLLREENARLHKENARLRDDLRAVRGGR